MTLTPQTLFTEALKAGASDVHVAVGSPVLFRIDGLLVEQTEKAVTEAEAEKFVKAIAGDAGYKRLQEKRELDTSYSLEGGVRLRVNAHFERGNMGLAARIIPSTIPAVEDLGLGEIAQRFCNQKEGLILFTGPTGAGKSTSLAALIQSISQQRAANIVTLEDPIEFIFPKAKSLIKQRQFGEDFLSFPDAMRGILRQDPDIVMVGEMRDPETIAAALTLAETGHLIFATLHTPNAVQTIDRIIDVFEPHQQGQVRSQLSMSLKAVVAQRLLPGINGGRVAQREILVNTPAAANIIRDARLQELRSVLQTGSDTGMISFEKDAKRLYKEGLISKETYELATEGL
jgi:twitching motility protein PilT